MPKQNLDNLDITILSMLSENARKPYLEISRECGVSGAAVQQVIRHFEQDLDAPLFRRSPGRSPVCRSRTFRHGQSKFRNMGRKDLSLFPRSYRLCRVF